MKKNIIIIYILSLGIVSLKAQTTTPAVNETRSEPTDSTQSHDLQEIVVEGKTQQLTSRGAVFTPTKAEKNSAIDAIDLLARMSIPQIDAKSGSTTITDRLGRAVAIFINYLPASEEDLKGMRTSDVRRVEYLEYPTDPRFHGADKVVNFIMKEIQYGGYTKIGLTEHVMVGLASDANVFSKFQYKSMTYDLYAGALNWNDRHSGNSTMSIFKNLDIPSADNMISREQNLLESHKKQGNYPVTFRATYSSDKITIQNKLGFLHYGMGMQQSEGSLHWTPSIYNDTRFRTDSPEQENILEFQGYYDFRLPHEITFAVMPYLSYGHNTSISIYETDSSLTIDRVARDNVRLGGGSLYLGKHVNSHNYLSLQMYGYAQHDDIIYTGSAKYEDSFDWTNLRGDISYSYYNDKLNISPKIGITWIRNKINGIKSIQIEPSAQFDIRYMPDQKNSVELYAHYGISSANASMKSPDIFQQNELLYYSGNPHLKNNKEMGISLTYGFIPSNIFSLSAYAMFARTFDKMTSRYEKYLDGNALKRTYVNDGQYTYAVIGASATLSLFNRKLRLSVTPNLKIYEVTGELKNRITPFEIQTSISYYLNNFYFSAFYMTRQKNINRLWNALTSQKGNYYLQAGWANGIWNIRLTASRFLRYKWDYSTSALDMDNYYEKSINYGQVGHASLALHVDYTFGYGKKTQRGNEVGATSTSSSAILK